MGKQTIIYVVGFILIFSIHLHNGSVTGASARGNVYTAFERRMAENIADSGIEYALGKLTQSPGWRTGLAQQQFSGGRMDVSVFNRADIGPDAVQILSRAQYGSARDSALAVLTVTPVSNRFSRFSYFSNTEPYIWFYSRDTLYGPVHTNGRFHMSGTPTFHGLVSSVSSGYDTYGSTNPNFHGGTDFGREAIDLQPDFTDLQYAAQNGGRLVLNNTLYLRFIGDETYSYKIGTYGAWQNGVLPTNGVIACNRDIYVEGTVNGQITIASTQDVHITGDIEYDDDPRGNPDSDDLLGIVAYDDVIVEDNASNRNGCTIQAAILARDGSFRAENYDFYPSVKLELYGGIVQEQRGPVGRLGTPPSGFEKMYRYDERMETIYPPFYPIAEGAIINLNRKAFIKILYWIG